MEQVKRISFNKVNGEYRPIFELEDGKIIEMEYMATGSCWGPVFREQEPRATDVTHRCEDGPEGHNHPDGFANVQKAAREIQRDPLFDKIVEFIKRQYVRGENITTEAVRIHMHTTYGRASSLIDQLEQHGIISPKDGAKPRKVL